MSFKRGLIRHELVEEIKKPVVLNDGTIIPYYGLHWWLINYNGVDVTYARGILGQYIITIPAYNMVIVRLGIRRGEKNEKQHPADLYDYLDLAKSIYDQEVIPLN